MIKNLKIINKTSCSRAGYHRLYLNLESSRTIWQKTNLKRILFSFKKKLISISKHKLLFLKQTKTYIYNNLK